MKALPLLTTVAMTALAALIAWAAWEYSRPLVAAVLEGQARAFVLEFRFLVPVVAVFLSLGLGEWLVSAVRRRLAGGE